MSETSTVWRDVLANVEGIHAAGEVGVPDDWRVQGILADNETAISYLNPTFTEGLKPILVDGVVPTPQAIRLGRYPLAQPLYVSITTRASNEAQYVILYMLSDSGQHTVEELGYTSVRRHGFTRSPP